MPQSAPTKTPTPTKTPSRQPEIEPSRRLNPERLCPQQGEGVGRTIRRYLP